MGAPLAPVHSLRRDLLPSYKGHRLTLAERRRREEQAIKPFLTVASLENAEQVAVESSGLACGPEWQGSGM